MKPPEYFLIKVLGDSSRNFSRRWKTPDGQALENRIRAALVAGEEIPDDIDMVDAAFGNGVIKLADLRGIDLSHLVIGNVDLTYCCFDGANFTETKFDGTLLQYSSMDDAKFDASEWDNVQASPVSACRASFISLKIRDSFLMCSNLEDVKLKGVSIKNTALGGSLLGKARLSDADYLEGVDISQILLTNAAERKRLAGMAGTSGEPKDLVKLVGRIARIRKLFGSVKIEISVMATMHGVGVSLSQQEVDAIWNDLAKQLGQEMQNRKLSTDPNKNIFVNLQGIEFHIEHSKPSLA